MACAVDARRDREIEVGSFSLGHWLIVGAFAFGVWRLLRNAAGGPSGATMICTRCEHQGQAVKRTRGHMAIELVLWLLLIVPGVIYSVWRMSTRHMVCAKCGSAELVPLDTPAGQRLARQQQGPAEMR
jgi:hypothetical protein